MLVKPTKVKEVAKAEGFRTSKGYIDALDRHVEYLVRLACRKCLRKTLMVEDVANGGGVQ